MADTTPITRAEEAEELAVQALSDAGAFCGVCGFEPGDRGCPDCESAWARYVKALREAGWAPRAETFQEASDRLRLDSVDAAREADHG